MSIGRPCLTCGLPSPGSYCPEHEPAPWQHRKASARARGYDTAWQKLSARARRLQPWCSDARLSPCDGPLTADHLPSAWARKAAGKALRLADVEVVCAGHNTARGTSRAGSERAEVHGTCPGSNGSGPRGKPQGPSLSSARRDHLVRSRADRGSGAGVDQQSTGVDVCLTEIDRLPVIHHDRRVLNDPDRDFRFLAHRSRVS